jgi:hypothetical protein
VFRSDDAAGSWVELGGLPDPVPAVTDLVVDPFSAGVLHLRAVDGCYRSSDGGQSWQLTKLGSATSLVLDTTRPNVLYAGLPSDGVFRTTDGGVSGDSGWANLTAGVSNSGVNDVKVALTAADAQTIYARFLKAGEADVYRSIDGGTSWDLRSSPSFYVEVIAADASDPAIVYVAGVDFYRSDDGGETWTLKPGAHADHHRWAVDPSDSATIYTACDGGLYRSTNRADTWAFAGDGLANTLFYDLAVAATQAEITIGGTQDNGTVLYDGSSTVWSDMTGGDGATVAIDPANVSVMYAMDQYADSISQSTNGGGSFTNIAAGLPTGGACGNLYYQVHPTSPNILLACCGSLWWTTSPGAAWTELFTPPTGDNVGVCAVDASTDIYYAATDQGNLFAGIDGANWQLVFTHPLASGCTRVVIDPDDPHVVYAAFRGRGQGRVYRLRRPEPLGPLQATDVTNNLPAGLRVRTLAVDAMTPFTIYAGTHLGVYRARAESADAQPDWSAYMNGMPRADVRALCVQPQTGVMRAATFGRSAYEVNTDDPIGSLIETVGCIIFLRAHELGSGYGKPPNFLDCEVIVLLAEEPYRAFGFQLRADQEQPTRQQMLDLLRAAFIADRPIRIDYVKTGPRVGEIIRVANP